MKRILFVFNPNSGKGLIKSKLYEVIDTFTRGGYEVSVYPTQAAMDGYNYIVNSGEGYDMVVCSGGDGTLNEVVSAIRKRELDVPVGYIPAGSTNDFATSVGISKNMKEAAKQIVDGRAQSMDIGTLNGRPFNYVAAFGAFTEVSYATSQDLKNIIGHSAYVVEAFKLLTSLKSYRMTLHINGEGGEVIKDDFVYGMISNSRYVAGMKDMAGKGIKMNDGLFEVTFIKQPKNPMMLEQVFSGLLMNNITERPEVCVSRKVSSIYITTDDSTTWTLDGEYGGIIRKVDIQVVPSAYQLVTTKDI